MQRNKNPKDAAIMAALQSVKIITYILQKIRAFFLFPYKEPLACIAILLLGFARASSEYTWLCPIAHIFGFPLLFYAAYTPSSLYKSYSTFYGQKTAVQSSFFFRLWAFLFYTSCIQLYWLTSHPYIYMWFVLPLISLILSCPLALIFLPLSVPERIFETPCFFWLKGKKRVWSVLAICSIAFLATMYEKAITMSWPGISFYTTALLLSAHPLSGQFAAFFGREGLCFIIYLSAIVGFLWIQKICPEKDILNKKFLSSCVHGVTSPLFSFFVGILIFPYCVGACRIYSESEQDTQDTLCPCTIRATLCHMEEDPDIFEMPALSSCELATQEWKKILRLLISQIPPPEGALSADIIVIPEGAIPFSADAQVIDILSLIKYIPNTPTTNELCTALFALHHEKKFMTSLELLTLLCYYFKTSIAIGLEGRRRLNRLCHIQEDRTYSFQDANSPCNCLFYIVFDSSAHNAAPYYYTYAKQLLIPFGEYIPFPWMKSLLALYGVHASFTPGSASDAFFLFQKQTEAAHALLTPTSAISPSLCTLQKLKFSPLICYEETFSQYAIKAMKLNPACFITIANDSWFAHSRLQKEHFELARLAALETARPFLRSTNQGSSGVIDYMGRVVVQYNGEEGNLAIQTSVILPQRWLYKKTLYTHIASSSFYLIFEYSLSIITIFVWGCSLRKRKTTL